MFVDFVTERAVSEKAATIRIMFKKESAGSEQC
jgi:hypothetical protein